MKTILRYIKRLFRVQYRLTTIERGKAKNCYCNNKRIMKNMLRTLSDVEYWTVYKTGPFFLAEREINKGMKGETA